MAAWPRFDVIVVGGIAGSALGRVLARARLGVLVVEKKTWFRDRVRGEGTDPFATLAYAERRHAATPRRTPMTSGAP